MAGKKQNEDEIREFAMKLYESVCANIRISDDISFKLMGFVPLTSGAGAAILSLAKVWTTVNSLAVILLSLVAATITFGLYKWEMRNVEKCKWLIDRAGELEQYILGENRTIYQFYNWKALPKPPLFSLLDTETALEEKKPNVESNIQANESENKSEKAKDIYWYETEIGKTEAEKIIYRAAIIAWVVPIIIAVVS